MIYIIGNLYFALKFGEKKQKNGLCAMIWVQNPSSVPQTQALCHNSKQIIQEFGTSRITQKAQLFAAFVSLQGKTMFIWQIKVAKTAKAKLCATKHGIGGPGVLWHIKIRYLPNAVSQSLRIQLVLNSLIRTPVSLAEKHSKAKTGKLSPEFGTSRILKFWHSAVA